MQVNSHTHQPAPSLAFTGGYNISTGIVVGSGELFDISKPEPEPEWKPEDYSTPVLQKLAEARKKYSTTYEEKPAPPDPYGGMISGMSFATGAYIPYSHNGATYITT